MNTADMTDTALAWIEQGTERQKRLAAQKYSQLLIAVLSAVNSTKQKGQNEIIIKNGNIDMLLYVHKALVDMEYACAECIWVPNHDDMTKSKVSYQFKVMWNNKRSN